ncbi:hypothetical protein Poli38472_007871 [Pythium oligandrum]|uniref:Uncharacterized protein n=1 Tax=Pythium oligandrum TaxID=41045 RepID=A0A8K1CRD7_PYTOL|nr:hypothetical protein Poli38472_007871 [Pythium oligandrum]|eukprot:TMW68199.1 hypothetical protein Poli38472_007871 [Pythium oligandrum]
MICQLALYPAFSVVFDQASGTVQVLLTRVFPALKYLMKKILHRYTSQLGEFSVEVAVSGVEIASSLYQSMIMQTAPSALAMGIIMGVDVVLGVVSVKFVMDKQSAIPKSQLIRRAYEILEIKTPSSTAELSTLPSKGSNTLPATSSTVPAGPLPVLEEEISPTTVVTPIVDDVVVRQALELASAAESVLLVEYFEVIVPIINCLFLVIGSTLPATQYNTRLAGFYRQPAAVAKAAKSILMYSFLQLLSCVAMHFVMKYRYGMSAAYQLSFVLERHGRSIQGKMLAWLPVIISFSLVHGGVDFSFKFNFSKGG